MREIKEKLERDYRETRERLYGARKRIRRD